MTDYPTYTQTNKSDGYTKPVSEVGGRLRSPALDVKNDCGDQVLDLSGKPGGSSVAMVTGRQWTSEQDAALDLSSHGKQTSGQAEALDLSKRGTPPIRPSLSQSHPVSVGILQSHQALPSRKLLEKALTSGLASSDFQLGPMSTGHNVSRLSDRKSPDTSRSDSLKRTYEALGVKPFSSTGFKPVGLSLPQVTLPNAGTRLVHAQKPIAITTPQPHNASVNTSRQSDMRTDASSGHPFSDTRPGIHTVVPSQTYRQETNRPVFNVQSLPFNTPGYVIPRPGSGLGIPTSFGAAIDHAVERYVIRRPENQEHNSNIPRVDTQLGFACPTCQKMFKSKAAMKLHTTVHKTSEERQFVCNLCQRRFLHRHHLIVHQRKHSGEKPYRCNACNKSFMAVFLLHKHLRKHTREQGRPNEISSAQLNELHGRRRSVSRSEGTDGFGMMGFRSADGIKVEKPELVIVSDDEDMTAVTRANVDDKGQSEERKSRSDDVHSESAYSSVAPSVSHSSETFIGSVLKPEVKAEELTSINANVEITNIEIKSNSVKILASSVKEKDGNGVKTKFVIKEIEYDTTFDSDRKNEHINVNKELKKPQSESVSVSDRMDSADHILETVIGSVDNRMESNSKENQSTDSVAKTEFIDPWPKYTSDDEIELDYLTGELKVLDKSVNKVKSENSGKIPEATETTKAPEDSIKVHSAEIELNEHQTGKKSPCVATITQKDIEVTTNGIGQIDHTEQTDGKVKELCTAEKRNNNDFDQESKTEILVKRFKFTDTDIQKDQDLKDRNIFNTTEYPLPCASKERIDHRKSKGRRQRGRKKIKRFKCETCARNFYSQHHLLLHMNTHKKNRALDSLKKAKANQINVAYAQKSGFSCTVCNKSFLLKKGLNSHMRIHSSKLAENKLLSRRFRDFMTDVKRKRSKESVKNLKSVTNVESQEKYNENERIEMNVNDSIVNVSDQFTMSETNKNTSVPVSEDKIQVIIGEDKVRRYVCYACNNTYTTKQKLKMHALIHKDNCYLCDMCGKSFFREITLQKHVSTHMLPRPHVCIICQKSFIHRSSLMRHKSIHDAPSTPSVKQQSQDVKFELEMLDTYAMLRKERLEKLQKEKMDDLSVEASSAKLNVIDLSLPRRDDQLTPQKPDENLQPPKLSPMNMSASVPSTTVSMMHLSPPNITRESVIENPIISTAIKNETEMPLLGSTKETKMTISSTRPQAARALLTDNLEKQQRSEERKLPRQRRRKSRVYPTSCRICKEVFPNVIALKGHMSVHNSIETHLYECNVCGHRFTQSCSLLRHLKTSCGDGESKMNKMQCTTCEKVFQRRNAFDRHMESHISGEPPKLNVSLHDTHRDEIQNSSPKLFQINVDQPTLTVEIKQEVKKDETNEQVSLEQSTLEIKTELNEDEVSEAETIPYGKTSSDESNDGFSDTSETESDNELPRPQSMPPTNSSLSLLSEVCSSLISIEKEKEAEIKKQNELISVQKELETIDILARLSGQNVEQRIKAETQPYKSITAVKDSMSRPSEGPVYHVPKIPTTLIPKLEPLDNEQTTVGQESAKIPTVVTDMESEAEKRHRSYFLKMQQRIFGGTPRSRPGNSPSTVCTSQQHTPTFKSNSLLAAALFDKGKPEPSHVYKAPATVSSDMMPTDLSMKKKTIPVSPLNLSPRSSPILRETLMSSISYSKVPQPPPLVTVFKCPNCDQLLYNKADYRQHMRGHGISPPDSPPQYTQIQQQGPIQGPTPTPPRPSDTLGRMGSTAVSASLPLDYTDIKIPTARSWTLPNVKRETESSHTETSHRLLKPPSTLNISPRKYGISPLAIPSSSKSTPSHSAVSTPDLDSPMYSSSDMSDVALSPLGSASLNTDILRKELRNKIYARRKSQGLEELTVEFKPPEKTEMTEEEREKLQHRRESNRQAAQRSRMRKKDRIISLLDELHQEESVQKSIRQQMEIMENEKKALLSILENHECVKDKHS